jgi:hypothetical protein
MKQNKMRRRLKRRSAAIIMPTSAPTGRWGNALVSESPELGVGLIEDKRIDAL